MKVTKRLTCDILDLPAYLSSQSEQGLHVKKLTGNRIIFEQGEGKSYDYNIIPVNNSHEFDRLYDMQGWSIILTYGEFVLIRAPKGTPLTLVIDDNVTLVKLSFMRTMYIIKLALSALGSFFSLLGIVNYFTNNPWLCALSAVMHAILIVYSIKELMPMIRVIKSIKKLEGGR